VFKKFDRQPREIAGRIIRACANGLKPSRVLPKRTVKLACEDGGRIGLHRPGPSSESYLNIPNIIRPRKFPPPTPFTPDTDSCLRNTYFADVCDRHILSSALPKSDRTHGDKAAAPRRCAKPEFDVPGSDGPSHSTIRSSKLAKKSAIP